MDGSFPNGVNLLRFKGMWPAFAAHAFRGSPRREKVSNFSLAGAIRGRPDRLPARGQRQSLSKPIETHRSRGSTAALRAPRGDPRGAPGAPRIRVRILPEPCKSIAFTMHIAQDCVPAFPGVAPARKSCQLFAPRAPPSATGSRPRARTAPNAIPVSRNAPAAGIHGGAPGAPTAPPGRPGRAPDRCQDPSRTVQIYYVYHTSCPGI